MNYKDESKLSRDSVIVLTQIRVIDKNRLIEKISKVNKSIMKEIENDLLFVLKILKI